MREAYPAIQAAGATAVLVAMSEPAALKAFKEQWRLPFICLSDPQQEAYRAFQCPRGGLAAVAGPAMWGRAIKSLVRHGAGVPKGDVMQLPGSFVIDRTGTICFVHRSQHSADWASPEQMLEAVRAMPKDN